MGILPSVDHGKIGKIKFDGNACECGKEACDMDSKSNFRNNKLLKRTKKLCWLLFGFILLFCWFGIRLATIESPTDWKEGDITVTEVRYVSRKPQIWRITDTEGNAYKTCESHIADQIFPQSTYHIVWSPDGNLRAIRAVSQGDTIIMDYADSVSFYCERNVWDWLFAILGLAGSITTVVCMFVDIRRMSVNRDSAVG